MSARPPPPGPGLRRATQSASVPAMKLLLYVTTHLSAQHAIRMEQCWNMTTAHPALANADLHFFVPQSKWSWLRSRFPHATYNAPRALDNTTRLHKQRGAIDAMNNSASRKLFRAYDWIVRLNPDVTIVSFAPIYSQMTEDVDALVGDCKGRMMTDFAVFRPRAIDRDPVPWICPAYPYVPYPNAECEMTHMLQPAVLDGRVRTIYNTSTYACRFVWKGIVEHQHGQGCTHAHTIVSDSLVFG